MAPLILQWKHEGLSHSPVERVVANMEVVAEQCGMHIYNPAHRSSVHKAFGLSLPEELLTKIDNLRGDIPRSRYIKKILEKTIQ